MSAATLESTIAPPKQANPRFDKSFDWKTPTGPADSAARPRTERPTFTYRGYADAHWSGQTCHLIGAASPDERTVIMACGCHASVPWWTLEPIATV